MSKLALVQNLKIILKVSRPHKEHLNNKGRVTDELDKIPQDSEVYLCGNPAMVEQVCEELKQEKKKKNIEVYKEAFTLSSNYKGRFHHHVIEGNIPYLQEISWGIIIFSLFGVIPAWMYMQSI